MMGKSTIVLADNDPTYLKLAAELLKNRDYKVITAESDTKLVQILGSKEPDLAILDVRLKDDRDENDVSGIVLARTLAPKVPKLLLTRRPSVEVYRRAFAPGSFSQIGLVDKRDKPDALLAAVDGILRSTVRTGWILSTWRSKRPWHIVTVVMSLLAILSVIAAVAFSIPKLLMATALLAIIAIVLVGVFME
jgi:DNA-binding NtrC family response regulator